MQAAFEAARIELELGLVLECIETLEGSGLLGVEQIDGVAFYKLTEAQVCVQALQDAAGLLYVEASNRR